MIESAPVYGLQMQTDQAMPGLAGAPAKTAPDVRLFLRAIPDWLKTLASKPTATKLVSPDLDDHGRPFFVVYELTDGDFYRLCYSTGAEFIVDRTGTRIWAEWPGALTLEDVSAYLFGPVMGWILRLRGGLCLHASAVAVDDRAMVFVGPSGAGKSTTAAAFANRGYAVLADDVVAISEMDGQFLIQPGYPGVRLCPTSVTALFGSEDALPALAPAWGKRLLDLRQAGYRFQDAPLPLQAVYHLSDDATDARDKVRHLTDRAALMSLVANTHAGRLLNRAAREREFDLLANLVANVPVREVQQGRDLATLPELCDIILADFHRHRAAGDASAATRTGHV